MAKNSKNFAGGSSALPRPPQTYLSGEEKEGGGGGGLEKIIRIHNIYPCLHTLGKWPKSSTDHEKEIMSIERFNDNQTRVSVYFALLA